ncbi:MAG: hypothetical protein FK733_12790 [Asgard group archaeon]|nr:hypothetical protein [Asgard group archaeon]
MTQEIRNKPTKEKLTERIASLDFCRGLAIILMTFFHGFHHVFDPTWFIEDPTRILQYNPIFIVPVACLVYLGTWNSFFLLVSVVVNTLTMVRTARKGRDLKQVVFKNTITAIFLLIADFIIEKLLYYGYFGNGIRNLSLGNSSAILNHPFSIHTLRLIAISLVLTSIVNYFLLRKGGHKKLIRNVIIYCVSAVAIIAATKYVHLWVDNISWIIPEGSTGWASVGVYSASTFFKKWFAVLLGGQLEPLFPFLGTAFLGAMIGLIVAEPKPYKHFQPILGTAGLLAMITGGILIAFGFPFIFAGRPSMPVYFLQIGGQVGLLMSFFRGIEYKGKENFFANHWISRTFRRWAMIALSLYAMEILDVIPEMFWNIIVGQYTDHNFLRRTFGPPQIGYALLVAIFSFIWYNGLVKVWAKLNFIFSFEWFLINIQGGFVKTTSNRLNEDIILNKTKWVTWADEKQIEKISNIKRFQRRFTN